MRTLSSYMVDASACVDRDGMIQCPLEQVAVLSFPPHEKILHLAYPHADDINLKRTITLGDQSLLLKYINPHSATVVSYSEEDHSLVTTVVDTVSARVLYRALIPYGSEPVSAVTIENHVVVSYWNAKSMRPEMSSVMLVEGMVGKSDLGPLSPNPFANEPAFSSFSSLPPIALQKTYISPKAIKALFRTLTTKGLSNKNILIGTVAGQIQSVDLRAIHPRRPLGEPSKTEKEEGLVQYTPYLHLSGLSYASHNLSIANIEGIVAGASNLESTSLLLAFGLDLFFNHVKPSQSFDILSSDFNYSLLVIILVVLGIIVNILRRMAKSKALKAPWM